MSGRDPNYVSFLLRMWKGEQNAQPVWHASLEDTTTRDRKNFATVETLIAFLARKFGAMEHKARDDTDPANP